MSISYTHLVDGADFTSASLNSRFEDALGVEKGINALTVDDFRVGALRENHIPSFIYGKNKSRANTLFSQVFHQKYEIILTKTTASWEEVSTSHSIEYTTNQQFIFDYATDNISALLLLGNINVVRWHNTNDNPIFTEGINEDYRKVDFSFELESALTARYFCSQAVRRTSPRVTIYKPGTVARSLLGTDTELGSIYDYHTDQDVALRTVILPSDVTPIFGTSTAGLAIRKIHLMINTYGDKVLINKANLTAIPIQAKVI